MMKILFTAFDNTSSERIVKNMNEFDFLILKNDKLKSVEQIQNILMTVDYNYIFSLGQRPLIKNKVYIESQAVVGNEKIETTLDISLLKRSLENHHLTARISNNAGTSYCNNIYFHAMKTISENSYNTKMVFIHIPYLKNISDTESFSNMLLKGINNFVLEEL